MDTSASTRRRLTHLARRVDPSVPSNRLAILGVVAGFVAGTLVLLLRTEATLLEAALDGARYGIGGFLAWAIARELDPDSPVAARYALFLYPIVALTGIPELTTMAAALVAARVVVRSTGLAPSPVDLAALVILAGLSAMSPAGFIAAAGLAAALWLDTRLDTDPEMMPQIAAAAVALGAAFVVTLLTVAFADGWRGPTALEATVVVVATAAVGRMRGDATVARADRTREPLDPLRVRRGQQLLAAVAALAIVWTGFAATGPIGPLLAAIIGTGIACGRKRRG